MLSQFLAQCQIPYVRTIGINITAETKDEATRKARDHFGRVLVNETEDVSLLKDHYDQTGGTHVPAEFRVLHVGPGVSLNPDTSVTVLRQRDAAWRAVRALLRAYQNGADNGGSMDWSDVDEAYREARQAIGMDPT